MTVAISPGQQAPADQELEDLAIPEPRRFAGQPALGEETGRRRISERPIGRPRVPGEVESVLIVRARERVQRIPAIPVQVSTFLRRKDVRGQRATVQDYTYRMQSRPAIGPNGGQEREPHTELVEQFLPGLGQIRPFRSEFRPAQHWPIVAPGGVSLR